MIWLIGCHLFLALLLLFSPSIFPNTLRGFRPESIWFVLNWSDLIWLDLAVHLITCAILPLVLFYFYYILFLPFQLLFPSRLGFLLYLFFYICIPIPFYYHFSLFKHEYPQFVPAIAMMIAYLPVLEERERKENNKTYSINKDISFFNLGFVDERVRERG